MYRHTTLYLGAIAALSVLAACGGASEDASSAPTAASPTRALASSPPAPVATPTAATLAATVSAPTAAAAQAVTGEMAIPQGLTPEGYHTLGRADAPVTLVMYSDFL
jgi:protein-disulfide isomerase